MKKRKIRPPKEAYCWIDGISYVILGVVVLFCVLLGAML